MSRRRKLNDPILPECFYDKAARPFLIPVQIPHVPAADDEYHIIGVALFDQRFCGSVYILHIHLDNVKIGILPFKKRFACVGDGVIAEIIMGREQRQNDLFLAAVSPAPSAAVPK